MFASIIQEIIIFIMKKTILYIVTLFLLCSISQGYAQKENSKGHHNIKLGVEFGTDFLFGTTRKPDMVRENKSSYDWFDDHNYYCGFIGDYKALEITYLGIKPEIFFAKNRIGIATGIRLSRYFTTLNSDRNYYLWSVHQDETHTEYIKIRNIKQNSYYLGFPVEARFFPNKRELPVQFYLKTGAVFNYRIHTDNKVKFQNPVMETYAETVRRQADQNLKDFNSYMFLGVGLKVGRFHAGKRKYIPHFNVEVHVLDIMLTDKASSFIRANAGFGCQMTVQIPIGKTVPIGSRN
jgi:hypothetical protein